MSDNPPPSSAPNTSSAINSLSLSVDKSRVEELYENAGPTPSQSEGRTAPPSRLPHSFIQFHIETTDTHRPRPDERPTKRMRMQDSEERLTGRSSPSESSQSDRGDHGSEGDQLLPPASPTTYEFAEPKKKRTRTLTTPHQAAVLHALLAQSRFPTTAMREEVGKQIGLSARKVQIWFQNQRQKARRPPPPSAPSVNRHPTYGPSAGAPPPGSPSTEIYGASFNSGVSQSNSSRQSEHPWASGQRRRGVDGRFLPPEDAPQSLTPGFWLSGPGMPGATQNAQAGPSSGLQRTQSSHDSRSPRQFSNHSLYSQHAVPTRRHSQSPPRVRSIMSRSSSLRTSSGDIRDRSFNRTLPPLVFDTSHTRGARSPSSPANYQLPSTTRSAPSAIPSFESPCAHSESPFAHDLPGPCPPRDLSAPFALQPMPHWDNISFGSHSRPSTSSWSRPSTSYSAPGDSPRPSIRSHERLVSDLVAQQHIRDAVATPRQSPIARRFDPVYDSVSANEANRYASGSPPSAAAGDARDQKMMSPK